MAKAKVGTESKSAVFTRLFESRKDLLQIPSIDEILKLYDFTDSEETRSMIAGVQRVSSRRTVRRPDPRGGSVCTTSRHSAGCCCSCFCRFTCRSLSCQSLCPLLPGFGILAQQRGDLFIRQFLASAK